MDTDVLTLDLPTRFLPKPKRSKQSRVEVFSVENDLSAGERFIVADQIKHLAVSLADEEKGFLLCKEADRYQNCGKGGVLFVCPNDNLRYFVPSFCRSRICESCARIYVKRLYPRIRDVVVNARRQSPANFILSQITLTIPLEDVASV